MYCQRFKTRAGAEKYVARQRLCGYTIQPTVIKKAFWTAGPEFSLTYVVYLDMNSEA